MLPSSLDDHGIRRDPGANTSLTAKAFDLGSGLGALDHAVLSALALGVQGSRRGSGKPRLV